VTFHLLRVVGDNTIVSMGEDIVLVVGGGGVVFSYCPVALLVPSYCRASVSLFRSVDVCQREFRERSLKIHD
jgi:hypothetical protein